MHSENKQHILPLRVYIAVAGALLLLTVITVAVSYLNLGSWNVVVAIGIASVKVSLVALFFMHLKYDKKINLFAFLIGVVFVAIFIILTMFDTLRRADIYEIQGNPIKEQAIIYDESPEKEAEKAEAAHE